MPSSSEESQDTGKGTHVPCHPKRRSRADSARAQMLELLNRDNRDTVTNTLRNPEGKGKDVYQMGRRLHH